MQNRINDQAAFILHRRDFSESSIILELFTQDFGRINVLVKGAKKRRDAGHFQTGNRLLTGWAGRAELKILTQIESRPLQIPLALFSSVFYVNELLLYLLPKDEEQRVLFQRYQQFLLELAQHDRSLALEPLLRSFEMDLLNELGLMPELCVDHVSGQAVVAKQHYRFSMLSGVVRTELEESSDFAGGVLLCIHHRQFDSATVLQAAKRLMRQIIDYNLQGRTLQSRKFYQQLNQQQ
jgi:DNA repair protein RecO (recombination protein O)